MKIITWNLNSRTNKIDLIKQCEYLNSGNFDVITLQEVLIKSEKFFKDYFCENYIASSFDLVKDQSILKGNRKFGQLVISKKIINEIPVCSNLPFPERVLSVRIDDFELHTTHVPPGSSNGVIKVKHLEEFYKFISKRNEKKQIITGDFNSPQKELISGEIVTWGQKINKNGKINISINPKWKNDCSGERWDLSERNFIQNHHLLGLKDIFRAQKGFGNESYSWYTNNGIGRRYDHIFTSNNYKIDEVFYDDKPRITKLSDHSPLICKIR